MTERPSARRNAFAPPAEVQRAIIKRNPKARPAPVAAVGPAQLPAPAVAPVATAGEALSPQLSRADALLDLTQQDAVDLVFALTESIEGANANVQRWAARGDNHRMDAAYLQAKRFETLRERIAAVIPRLVRKG